MTRLQTMRFWVRWTLSVALVLPLEVSAQNCPPGQIIDSDTRGHCCWQDQVWALSRGRCVGIPRCPSDFVTRGETCEAETVAPVASTDPNPDRDPPSIAAPNTTHVPLLETNTPEPELPGDSVPSTPSSSPPRIPLAPLPVIVRFQELDSNLERDDRHVIELDGRGACRIPCWALVPPDTEHRVVVSEVGDRPRRFEHVFRAGRSEGILFDVRTSSINAGFRTFGLVLGLIGAAVGTVGLLAVDGDDRDLEDLRFGLMLGGAAGVTTGLSFLIAGAIGVDDVIREHHVGLWMPSSAGTNR